MLKPIETIAAGDVVTFPWQDKYLTRAVSQADRFGNYVRLNFQHGPLHVGIAGDKLQVQE